MTNYNLSEIMTSAHTLHKMSKHWVNELSFGECLRRAWAKAKEDGKEYSGIIRNVKIAGTLMHPVLVNISFEDMSVSGNTFAARQQLASMGFTWSQDARAWMGNKALLTELCKKYA